MYVSWNCWSQWKEALLQITEKYATLSSSQRATSRYTTISNTAGIAWIIHTGRCLLENDLVVVLVHTGCAAVFMLALTFFSCHYFSTVMICIYIFFFNILKLSCEIYLHANRLTEERYVLYCLAQEWELSPSFQCARSLWYDLCSCGWLISEQSVRDKLRIVAWLH